MEEQKVKLGGSELEKQHLNEVEKENSKKILDFFYKEETPTHVEVDEEGNETIVEDEPVKNLDWFKIGATSGGFLAVITAIIWFFCKHKHK